MSRRGCSTGSARLIAFSVLTLALASFEAMALCTTDSQCADGNFCNGLEVCNAGVCEGGAPACPGRLCDEVGDVCLGNTPLQPPMGAPLSALTQPQMTRFNLGKIQFARVFSQLEGLGPIFNQHSCASCHNTPVGGSGSIQVTRFGFIDEETDAFDPLASLGGSLLQSQAVNIGCGEQVPSQANITALRTTNSALGFGLVEAIPDAAIQANATTPPPGVSGTVHTVFPLESPSTPRVGRFGWKAQVATVLTFSADAGLNEMGITNRLVGTENDPNGTNAPSLGAPDFCDTVPDPEDQPDFQGVEFIDRLTDFQRYLAPPPQTPKSGMAGEALFQSIGCASCHMAAFTTPNAPPLEPALRNITVKPYSDFLLHDAGLAADFIEQGGAGQRELRTPPLWGLRARDPLWHDGRVAGGTFQSRVDGAVAQHSVLLGEGASSAMSYFALSPADQAKVVAFLDSLGRQAFDMDGDGDVDGADVAAFKACKAAVGPYTPNQPCAVSDSDADGDVDQSDFWLLLQATTGGAAGTVPNGVTGPPITAVKAAMGAVMLAWSASCAATDTDYAVYEGAIGNFTSHAPRLCSTGGLTTATLTPLSGSRYFLVVPINGFREGSYGTDSIGMQRPPGAGACLPQALTAACQ